MNLEEIKKTHNAPLAHACQNCQRIFRANGGKKIKQAFFMAQTKEGE